jgi:hypothetical protein
MRWLLALLLLLPLAAEARHVDVALVLAIDSSSSVDREEFTLQMQGLAEALRDPDVQARLIGGPHGAVAITVLEWSNADWQVVAEDWRVIARVEDADALAADLSDAPRRIWGGTTAIGAALARAAQVLAAAPVRATRQVIDLSGDGAPSDTRRLARERQRLAAAGITVNGLAILDDDPSLPEVFRRDVALGPGSFVIVANGYRDFARAMRMKLLQELQPGPLAQSLQP